MRRARLPAAGPAQILFPRCPRRRFSVRVQPDTPGPAPLLFQRDVAHTKQHERTRLGRFNKAIQMAATNNDFAASLDIATEMKQLGVTPNVTTYNQLILAAGSQHYCHNAQAIFDDMILLGIKPNAETFHALLYAYRHKPSLYMWPLLDKMKEMNIEPNAAIYAYITRFFSRESTFELALKLLQEAKDKNLAADLSATSTIVESLANKGHSRLAMDVAEAFERDTVRRLEPSVWITCLRAAANDLWGEGTLRCWQFIVQELGLALDEGLCMRVLHTAARNGLPDLASDVLRALKVQGIPWREHHFAPLIISFCHQKQLKSAFQVLSIMRSIDVDPLPETTLPILNLMNTSIDEFDAVWSILDELITEKQQIDVVVLNCMIKAAVQLADLQRAVGAYKSYADYNVTPNQDTYHSLIDGAIQASHRQIGDLVLADMKAADIKPNRDTYQKMVSLCLTQPTYEDAFFYLEELKAAGYVPSRDIYYQLVDTCCRAADQRYTVAIDDMLEHGHVVPSLYRTDMEKRFREAQGVLELKRQAAIKGPGLGGAAQRFIESAGALDA